MNRRLRKQLDLMPDDVRRMVVEADRMGIKIPPFDWYYGRVAKLTPRRGGRMTVTPQDEKP